MDLSITVGLVNHSANQFSMPYLVMRMKNEPSFMSASRFS